MRDTLPRETQEIEFKLRVTVESDSRDRAKQVVDRLLEGIEGLPEVSGVVELGWQRTRRAEG